MTVQVNDIVRAEVQGNLANVGRLDNTFYLRNVDSAISEAAAIDDIVEVLESLYVLLAALLTTYYTVIGVRGVNVTQELDVGYGLFTDTTPGTSPGPSMIPQAAYVLTLVTPRLGAQGRKFFGPVLEDVVDNTGLINAAVLSGLGDVGDLMSDTVVATATSWEFGVVSSVDDVWLPFTSYSIPLYIGSQRRRKAGVGI